MEIIQCHEFFLETARFGAGGYGFRSGIDMYGEEREAINVLHDER